MIILSIIHITNIQKDFFGKSDNLETFVGYFLKGIVNKSMEN